MSVKAPTAAFVGATAVLTVGFDVGNNGSVELLPGTMGTEVVADAGAPGGRAAAAATGAGTGTVGLAAALGVATLGTAAFVAATAT